MSSEEEKITWDDLIEDDDKLGYGELRKTIIHYVVLITIAYVIGSLLNLQLLTVLLSVFAKVLYEHYSKQQRSKGDFWRKRRTLQARRNVVCDYEEDSH